MELSGSLEFAVELCLAHLPGTLCQTFQIMSTVFRYLLRIVVILILLRYSQNTLFSAESGTIVLTCYHMISMESTSWVIWEVERHVTYTIPQSIVASHTLLP